MPIQDQASRRTATRLGVLLLAVGALATVDAALDWTLTYYLWPLLILLLAGGLLGLFAKSGRRARLGLAVGTFLLCFAVMALVLNIVGWPLLVRLWPLFIAFVGISFIVCYVWSGRRRFDLLAGLLLLSLSIVFALVFAVDGRYWGVGLMLAGASILAAEKAR